MQNVALIILVGLAFGLSVYSGHWVYFTGTMIGATVGILCGPKNSRPFPWCRCGHMEKQSPWQNPESKTEKEEAAQKRMG